MDFNTLPLAVKNRLLALHLKTHMQLVEDQAEDNMILHSRLSKRTAELEAAQDTIKNRNELLAKHRNFLRSHGLMSMFDNYMSGYQKEPSDAHQL